MLKVDSCFRGKKGSSATQGSLAVRFDPLVFKKAVRKFAAST